MANDIADSSHSMTPPPLPARKEAGAAPPESPHRPTTPPPLPKSSRSDSSSGATEQETESAVPPPPVSSEAGQSEHFGAVPAEATIPPAPPVPAESSVVEPPAQERPVQERSTEESSAVGNPETVVESPSLSTATAAGAPVENSSDPAAPPDMDEAVGEVVAPDAEIDEQLERRQAGFLLFAAAPGWLLSLIVHMLILTALAIYYVGNGDGNGAPLTVELGQNDQSFEEDDELIDFSPLDEFDDTEAALPEELVSEPIEDTADIDLLTDAMLETLPEAPLDDVVEDVSEQLVAGVELAEDFSIGKFGGYQGSATSLASRAFRRRGALTMGATAASEEAVERALAWLARQQRPNGSWRLVDSHGPSHCAATGLALLTFLGAGHTHLEGEYRTNVERGLRFLVHVQKDGGSYRESGGTMYSHGLATLALCEALAMSRYQPDVGLLSLDGDLENLSVPLKRADIEVAAQRAIEYTQKSQGKRGGWRYNPGQDGDTSVVGWQLMALKSGYLSGLDVERSSVIRTRNFLNQVAKDQVGSVYTYKVPTKYKTRGTVPIQESISATTPIGLLCRQYLGWDRDEPGLKLGVKRIARNAKPGKGMYFYYYATQVMHHYGGDQWQAWNYWMRDFLVNHQVKNGAQAGSWTIEGRFSADRLYVTTMAAMTLEVYYRYSQIYKDDILTAQDPTAPLND